MISIASFDVLLVFLSVLTSVCVGTMFAMFRCKRRSCCENAEHDEEHPEEEIDNGQDQQAVEREKSQEQPVTEREDVQADEHRMMSRKVLKETRQENREKTTTSGMKAVLDKIDKEVQRGNSAYVLVGTSGTRPEKKAARRGHRGKNNECKMEIVGKDAINITEWERHDRRALIKSAYKPLVIYVKPQERGIAIELAIGQDEDAVTLAREKLHHAGITATGEGFIIKVEHPTTDDYALLSLVQKTARGAGNITNVRVEEKNV